MHEGEQNLKIHAQMATLRFKGLCDMPGLLPLVAKIGTASASPPLWSSPEKCFISNVKASSPSFSAVWDSFGKFPNEGPGQIRGSSRHRPGPRLVPVGTLDQGKD